MLLWFLVAVKALQCTKANFSFKVKSDTGKLGKTGVFCSVEYYIFAKLSLLSNFRSGFYIGSTELSYWMECD